MKLSMPFGSDRGRSRERTPEAGTACGETKVAHRALLVCCFASCNNTSIYRRPTLRYDPIRTRPELLFLSLSAHFFCRDRIACGTLRLRIRAFKHARTHDRIHHTQLSHFFPLLRWCRFGSLQRSRIGPFSTLIPQAMAPFVGFLFYFSLDPERLGPF